MEWTYVGGDGDGVKNCWGKRRGGRREREKRLGEGEGDCEGCGIGDTEAGAKGGVPSRAILGQVVGRSLP